MKTLLHSELCDRQFGSALLAVADLKRWLQGKGVTVPSAVGDVNFIQVEYLLSGVYHEAIESVTHEEASAVVAADAALREETRATYPKALEDYDAGNRTILPGARHLFAVTAKERWRSLVGEAIAEGELRLLDCASRLPISKQTGAETDTRRLDESARTMPEVDQPRNGTRVAARIAAIVATAERLQYPLLQIPYGGKAAIERECLLDAKLFTHDTFLKAWKEAARQGRIRVEGAETYRPTSR